MGGWLLHAVCTTRVGCCNTHVGRMAAVRRLLRAAGRAFSEEPMLGDAATQSPQLPAGDRWAPPDGRLAPANGHAAVHLPDLKHHLHLIPNFISS